METNKNYILNELKSINCKKDLDYLEEQLREELKIQFSKNIDEKRLNSFNRLRKPIDLVIEHIISMSFELNEIRNKIISSLYLPMDSQIFNSDLFTNEELKKAGISKKLTYGNIISKDSYYYLQYLVEKKAEDISRNNKIDFFPIYFDLIWNDRYEKEGGNLFEVSL